MISSLIRAFHALSSWVIGMTSIYSLRTLSYGGGIFVYPNNSGDVYTSTDGITWIVSATGTTWNAYGSIYSTSTFVEVGFNNIGTPSIYTSTDGITWTSRSATGFGTTAAIVDICWSGTYLVVVSSEGHIATASSTGVTWTQRAKASYNFECVAFGAGIYIAYGNVAWTSTNGTTWTDRSATSPSLYAYSITYGASKFVAVGSSGKIYTTTDGITWTQRTSPFGTTTIRKVTYGASKFVAVGSSGKIATSIDGITWLLSESPTTANLYDVEYGAGKFVAIGSPGIVITSQTGL